MLTLATIGAASWMVSRVADQFQRSLFRRGGGDRRERGHRARPRAMPERPCRTCLHGGGVGPTANSKPLRGSPRVQERSESAQDRSRKCHHKPRRPKRSIAEVLRLVESPKEKKTESEIRLQNEERLRKANGERFLLRLSLSDDVFDHMARVANGPRGMTPRESEWKASSRTRSRKRR